MEDSDANHAQTSLPSNNTYAKVPNTTAPDSDGDGKKIGRITFLMILILMLQKQILMDIL